MPQRIPIPLASKIGQGASRPFSSEGLINMFAEGGEGGKSPFMLRSAPGLRLYSTIGGGRVRGQFANSKGHWAVVGTRLYSIADDGTKTDLGEIEGQEPVEIVDGGNEIAIVADDRTYVLDRVAGTIAEAVDPDFQTSVSAAFLGQRFFYARRNSGVVAWSDVLNAKQVDPLSFVTAESDIDDMVAVRASNQELVFFGRTSLEFWRLTGDEDVIAPSSGSYSSEVGCVSRDSIVQINNGLVWLGRDKRTGGAKVYRLNGYTPEPISTPAVDYALERAPSFADARGIGYMFDGHLFYEITIPDYFTGVYDFSSNRWAQAVRGHFDPGQMPFGDSGRTTFATSAEKRIVGMPDGNLYELTLDAFDLVNTPLVREITTGPWFEDNLSRTCSEIELVLESGTGIVTGQGSDPLVQLCLSNDGGRTWGPPRTSSLGKMGEYTYRARWFRHGRGRDWAAKFRVADPVKFTAMSLFVTVDPGTS
jgi:hypothetical protein